VSAEVGTGVPDAAREITQGMIRLYKEQLGRGPTKTRTWVHENMVVTVMGDSLTPAEKTLAKSDKGEVVRQHRRTLQSAMESGMRKLIEETLYREVVCILSDHSPHPDFAVEVMLLAPRTQPESDGSGGSLM
jgi:uncharacterized protein YbcI